MDSSDLPVYGLGYRHVQIALVFSMVVIMYMINMAPPIALVAMTDPGTSPNPRVPSFTNWNDQSIVLISFYFGFAPFQLFGGPLARKYGFKWFMVFSMLIASLISILIPSLIMKFGSMGLMFSFCLQGLCQGLIIPMLSDFISKWVPISERTVYGTFIFASKTLGTVFATQLTGLLASSWWGWPSAFYLYGSIGIIWSIFMTILGCNSPAEHSMISESERDYIERGKPITKKKVPWSKIIRSSPAWAVCMSHVGITWTIRLTTTELPTYMNRVLGFSVETCSVVLSITYLAAYLNTFLVSNISQRIINEKTLSTGTCRKICNSIASWGSAILLILLSLLSSESYLGLVLIFLTFICTNVSFAGFSINYNDVTPNYSGCLYGIGGLTSTVVSYIPLILVQLTVTNQTDSTQWIPTFFCAAAFTGLTNFFFIMKGSGETQEWDNPEEEESQNLLEKP
ncbi:hypothetical protein HHI36_014090 [Cryptolaemus montrouzieri]|uniref:Major facilitator superfamily (MFS) profile domain-containing protein n=1 Tax=Cryptolaemus montrouzieri TaxID=559131 RepID=A0ABD2N1R6_9CUCU